MDDQVLENYENSFNIAIINELKIYFNTQLFSLAYFLSYNPTQDYEVNDIDNTFKAHILSMDLSHLDTSEVTTVAKMFYGCNSLNSIEFSNIDTSKVTDMRGMFLNCQNLKFLDLSGFITSSAINMDSMFSGCFWLESIDLSNFDTKKVENMNNMFFGCFMLRTLNLSNFDTSSVTIMDSIFNNCNSLNILDISNFNMLQITSAENMFVSFNNIAYVNLYNTKDNGFISQSVLNTEDNGRTLFVCQQEDIITKENAEKCCNYNQETISCNYDIILTSSEISNDINIEGEIETIYNNITFDDLVEYNFRIIETPLANLQFSSLRGQKNNKLLGLSSIDLGECEEKLRQQEDLGDFEDFLIIILDIKNSSLNATYVQYEIYSPINFRKVSLDICNDIPITVYSPVALDEAQKKLILDLYKSGYNIFDINNLFYNDIYATYTALNGADMTLSLRKHLIYDPAKDIYLCQSGCEFNSFDIQSNKAKCDCKVQTQNIITDIKKSIPRLSWQSLKQRKEKLQELKIFE